MLKMLKSSDCVYDRVPECPLVVPLSIHKDVLNYSIQSNAGTRVAMPRSEGLQNTSGQFGQVWSHTGPVTRGHTGQDALNRSLLTDDREHILESPF